MEDEITSAIASELRVVLSPTTLAATRAGRTDNAEAHDLFMRGVFEKNKVTPQGLTRAITSFGDALKLDPHYAQAHAGMAFAYDILADVYRPSHEYHTLALEVRAESRGKRQLCSPRRMRCSAISSRRRTGTSPRVAWKWSAVSR